MPHYHFNHVISKLYLNRINVNINLIKKVGVHYARKKKYYYQVLFLYFQKRLTFRDAESNVVKQIFFSLEIYIYLNNKGTGKCSSSNTPPNLYH